MATAEKWDVFISHASEDKEKLVRPLAVALRSLGVSVWYDEFTLSPGDSLSRSIDKGIDGASHGLVVISPAFISKPWPEYELRGLVNREVEEDAKIIPIWHRVSRRDVLHFSPPLADKIAINTAGLRAQDVALSILKAVSPEIYRKHPRAELERRASGEAMAELQKNLEELREQLARFQCPFCGSPLSHMRELHHEYGDDVIEVFECGYEDGGGTPCPSDPKFPKLDEFDLKTEHSAANAPWPWRCYAIPRTLSAKRLGLISELGATEEDAKQQVLRRYEGRARPWKK
jgi:TIR domain-containing protein